MDKNNKKPSSTSKLIRHRHMTIMDDLKEIKRNVDSKIWKISHEESNYTGFHLTVLKKISLIHFFRLNFQDLFSKTK